MQVVLLIPDVGWRIAIRRCWRRRDRSINGRSEVKERVEPPKELNDCCRRDSIAVKRERKVAANLKAQDMLGGRSDVVNGTQHQGCGVGRFFRIPTPDSDSSSFEKPTPTPAVLKNRLRLQHF